MIVHVTYIYTILVFHQQALYYCSVTFSLCAVVVAVVVVSKNSWVEIAAARMLHFLATCCLDG